MPVHNADIAATFNEIANCLEIRGANPFRIRAYRKASRTVGSFEQEFKQLIEHGTPIPKLPGIGTDLSAKIREIVATGHCELLDSLRREVPPVMTELLAVSGLGPKRVQALYHELGIANLQQLKQAALAKQIRDVSGFGPKTEQRIIDALAAHPDPARRFLRSEARHYAEALTAYLKQEKGIKQLVIAGSYRRLQESIGDIDILVTTAADNRIMERFIEYDEITTVLAHGTTRSSVVLRNGLQIDLRLVKSDSYGSALHYFTGSKAHNIAIRRLARSRGLKVNEYGVFKGAERLGGETEDAIFSTLGLAFIPPELREDRGEIQAAHLGTLPHLIKREDIRGDLHLHTEVSDGKNSIKDMAIAARNLGWEYIAITDHSQHLKVAHGLSPQQLIGQMTDIDQLNRLNKHDPAMAGFTIFKGCEVDILEDGSLDLPDSVLQHLDIVIAAIHSKFDLSSERQTQRILRAMDNPYVNILAHPSSRLIGKRDPIAFDFPAVLNKAKTQKICLELNSQPERLDLNDIDCKMARDAKVMISINTDAHSVFELSFLQYGIDQARRGWLSANEVLNTQSASKLINRLQPRKSHGSNPI